MGIVFTADEHSAPLLLERWRIAEYIAPSHFLKHGKKIQGRTSVVLHDRLREQHGNVKDMGQNEFARTLQHKEIRSLQIQMASAAYLVHVANNATFSCVKAPVLFISQPFSSQHCFFSSILFLFTYFIPLSAERFTLHLQTIAHAASLGKTLQCSPPLSLSLIPYRQPCLLAADSNMEVICCYTRNFNEPANYARLLRSEELLRGLTEWHAFYTWIYSITSICVLILEDV